MDALIWSLLLPFVGPALALLWAGLGPMPVKALKFIEPAALLVVVAVICFNVVPANVAALGPWSLAVSLIAFLVAYVASRLGSGDDSGRELVQTAAFGGVLVHALADGAALFSFGGAIAIGPAIALDRFAIGALVWTMLQPRYGVRVGLLVIALLSGTTAAGYYLMEFVSRVVANPPVLGAVQSVLVGILLNLALDHWRGADVCCTEPWKHVPDPDATKP